MSSVEGFIMNEIIHSRFVSSISEFKKNPMEVVNNGFGEAVVILNRNKPAFYCVPPKLYEKLLESMNDLHLLEQANLAKNEPSVEVTIDELKGEVKNNE